MRVAAVAAMATGLVVLTACTTPAQQGSLTYADNGIAWCGDAARYKKFAVGIALDFPDGGPITLRQIRAVDADGLALTDERVLAVSPEHRVGTSAVPLEGVYARPWARASPAIGATVLRRQHRDLVVVVERHNERGGTIDDIRLGYEQDGLTYDVSTHTKVQILPDCSQEGK